MVMLNLWRNVLGIETGEEERKQIMYQMLHVCVGDTVFQLTFAIFWDNH